MGALGEAAPCGGVEPQRVLGGRHLFHSFQSLRTVSLRVLMMLCIMIMTLRILENSFHLLDTYYVSVVGTGKLCICIISFHLHTTLSHPHFTDEKTRLCKVSKVTQ